MKCQQLNGGLLIAHEQCAILTGLDGVGPNEQRVYRLRRDPHKARERRIRVFEQGRYTRDFCVVRDMACPEADLFLTCFLGLMSDELHLLSVVQSYNIFPPHSDGNEQETIPVRWQAREAVAV